MRTDRCGGDGRLSGDRDVEHDVRPIDPEHHLLQALDDLARQLPDGVTVRVDRLATDLGATDTGEEAILFGLELRTAVLPPCRTSRSPTPNRTIAAPGRSTSRRTANVAGVGPISRPFASGFNGAWIARVVGNFEPGFLVVDDGSNRLRDNLDLERWSRHPKRVATLRSRVIVIRATACCPTGECKLHRVGAGRFIDERPDPRTDAAGCSPNSNAGILRTLQPLGGPLILKTSYAPHGYPTESG